MLTGILNMETMNVMVKKYANPGIWLKETPIPTIDINNDPVREIRRDLTELAG